MGASRLRVVLAENGLTEVGLMLRSVCAEKGKVLELVRVGEGGDVGKAVWEHCPDIALLKLSLLQPDAAKRLRVLQENSPSIPFILLAEPADNVSAETCLEMGAADYLVEGYLDERTLERAVSAAIGGCGGGRKGAEAMFPVEQGELGEGWRRSGEREWVFTLTMGDGARMGREGVRQVLMECEAALRKSVRSTDEVKRVSETEWVVRMRNLDEAKRGKVQQRLEARLRNEGLRLRAGVKLEVGTIEEVD
jgi:CheY-like chemotaxis protein